MRARDGIVLAIATEGDTGLEGVGQDAIFVPDAPPLLQPLLTAIPLQYIAYHIAPLARL